MSNQAISYFFCGMSGFSMLIAMMAAAAPSPVVSSGAFVCSGLFGVALALVSKK